MAKRTNVRPIPGLAAPGSKPAGSARQIRQGGTPMTENAGPNLLKQKQNTQGGPGVNVNSQPVN